MTLWIVTIDGHAVNGTNAYTRRDAIHLFGLEDKPWKWWRDAGYDVVKVKLKK